MAVIIKNEYDIEKMRTVGRLAAEVLELLEDKVVLGISTGEIDRICHNHIRKYSKSDTCTLALWQPSFP